MRRFRLLLPLLALACALAAPAGASARTAPCEPGEPDGPWCHVWTGKVVFVDDGDTIDVDLDGDGTHVARRVRVTGIQAMEQTVYSHYAARRRGECHALAATARLESLIRSAGWRVRLAAIDPGSRSGERLRRSVDVRLGGRWVDAGRTLIQGGYVLWLPNTAEYAFNAEYADLADAAARTGTRIWDTSACGAGPSAGADLHVEVNWDAAGDDGQNVDGEWIDVENRSGQPVPLHGWWVRDSALRRFRFPAGAAVPAHGRVRVEVGHGTDGGGVFHWGLDAPALENIDRARGMGDGAYLFDPQGDLRAWQTYH